MHYATQIVFFLSTQHRCWVGFFFLINRIMERTAGARRHCNAKGTRCPPHPRRHLEGIPFPSEVNGKITALQAIFKSTGVLPERDWKIQKSALKPTLDSGRVARRLSLISLTQQCYSNCKQRSPVWLQRSPIPNLPSGKRTPEQITSEFASIFPPCVLTRERAVAGQGVSALLKGIGSLRVLSASQNEA